MRPARAEGVMEITRLSVAGVGRFADEVVVEGFGAGVNVLAAANEAGKSTLFRALRACIFERHKSKSREIESLRTQGANLPARISLDFTHDGRAYRIVKSFLRAPGASLCVDGKEIAKDRAADEMLWEILGIEPMNIRSVDPAAFAMLWVGQRDSFDLPPVTKAGETALGAAIQSEVGAIAGSEKAKAILTEMQAELAKYVTEKTGKPLAQGPLGQARRECDDCRTDLEAHRQRLAILEDQFATLERLRGERAGAADPAMAAQHERDLHEARGEVQAARQAADKLSRLEAEERRCHAQAEAASAKLTQLQTLAASIAEQRRRERGLSVDVEQLSGQEKQLRAGLAEARSQVRAIEDAEQADTERDRLLEQLGGAAAKRGIKAEAERKAALLTGILERRTKIRGECDACKVTAKALRSLDEAERELSLIEERLASAASTLSIALMPGAGPDILIDGRPAKDGESLAVTAPMTVAFGERATLTVSPPAGFGEDHAKTRASLLAKRAKLQAAAGVVGIEEARKAFARRQALETQLTGIDAELAAIGVEADGAEDALSGLQREAARLEAEIHEAMSRAGAEALPDPAAVEAERQAIAARRDALRGQRKILDAAIHEIHGELEAKASQRGALSGEFEELRRALSANLAALPEDRRDAEIAAASRQLDAARTAHQQAAGALADMRGRTPPPEELERLGNKLTRLEHAAANRKTQLAELDRTIANLEGQIQSAGGDGLGEKVAALESQLAQAEAELRRHEKRVAVARLLAETIAQALDESRERFYAPVLRNLKPYINDLFPGAALTLGDSFQVSGLRRDGAGPEDFSQLSDGTQEQIAVLVRLAMGALLADRGSPVPIILDDALVFSDDDRIERMFDALTRAGAKQQIIVLTCRSRTFAALGARNLKLTPASADGRAACA
jgi:DNA repair exonuclease SbcCD ATPase subunit